MVCFVFQNQHSVTPLVVSEFWYRVNILFNLLDVAIVLVVKDEKGEEVVVVLAYTHWKEGGQRRGNFRNTGLVAITDKSGFS